MNTGTKVKQLTKEPGVTAKVGEVFEIDRTDNEWVWVIWKGNNKIAYHVRVSDLIEI